MFAFHPCGEHVFEHGHFPPGAIMRVEEPFESSGLSNGCGGAHFVLLLDAWSGLEAKKELGRNDEQISRGAQKF